MSTLDFVIRLAVATSAGMLIGLERQWHNKSAGLRTHALVATGSAMYVLLSINLTMSEGDVTRIIGQVVSGVGFLGAGIIFKEGLNVHGLTTAATVWCSSAIGCLAAAGYFWETLAGTVIILIVNSLLAPVHKWLSVRKDKDDNS